MFRGAYAKPADAQLDPVMFCMNPKWEASFALPFHGFCHSTNTTV